MHTKLINIYTFMYMSQVILKNPNYAIILEDIKNDLDNYIEEYEGEKMKKIWILSMLVASLLLLVACNGESTELTTETSTAPTTIDITTETPTTQAPTTEAQTTGVVDTVPPVLSGVDDSLAYLNEPFDPLAGVSAWDEVDGDLTSEISYAGIVNTEQVGLYFLRYSVIDQSGNRTEASRYITVEKRPDEEEPDELAISVSKPYLFVNVDEPLILSDYIYRNEDGEITIDQGSFTQISENLSILDGSLVAHTSGINTFEYSYGGESFLVYVFSKLSEETDYLVYSMDFSELADGPIPSDYIIETMNGGSARILNGFLTIDSPAIEDPTRVLLPTYLSGLKNYIIDVDFSILTTVESTRWASVMYRFSPDNYFQMAIRQGAMAVNGVEF
ncbi:MAG: DUF5011 domain-containing protein, partial [Sphaerochaetaceae bacterium]|nr:DUF5011 domain-containing protein [Sphaerochaetaceae bacterium]